MTQPPPVRLLIDGNMVQLGNKNDSAQGLHRIFRMFKKESYTLIEKVKGEALAQLEVPSSCISVDLFANHRNFQESLYCTRQNSAWRYNWAKLRLNESEFLWANPPFSQLDKVLTKLAVEPTRLILVTPDWPGVYWARLLEKLAVAQVLVDKGTPLYQGDWDKKPLPSPQWNTLVTLVDSIQNRISVMELNPKLVKWIRKCSLDWGRENLIFEVSKYPKGPSEEVMERETQTPFVDIDLPDLSPIKGNYANSNQSVWMEGVEGQQVCLQAGPCPLPQVAGGDHHHDVDQDDQGQAVQVHQDIFFSRPPEPHSG